MPSAPHGGPLAHAHAHAHAMRRSSSAGLLVSRPGSALPGPPRSTAQLSSTLPAPPRSTAQLSSTPPARAHSTAQLSGRIASLADTWTPTTRAQHSTTQLPSAPPAQATPAGSAKKVHVWSELPVERVTVWAIALHNLATEQEALGLPAEASRSFAEASSIATSYLGAEHPVAQALCERLRRHELEAEQQLEQSQRGRQAFVEPPRMAARARSATQQRLIASPYSNDGAFYQRRRW